MADKSASYGGAVVGKVDVCRCSAGAGKCRSSRDAEGRMVGMLTSGKVPLEKTLVVERPMSATGMHRSFVRHDGDGEGGTYISRQVFPQAPSPTMTSLRRISAMLYRCTRQHALALAGSEGQDK